MERCQLLSEDNAFHLQKMRQARYFRSVNKVGWRFLVGQYFGRVARGVP